MPKKKTRPTKGKNDKSKQLKISFRVTYKLPETPYKTLRKTRNERKEKIEELFEHLTGFHIFVVLGAAMGLKKAVEGLVGTKVAWKKRFDELIFIIKQNEVITHSISMCTSEFMTFAYELQTGAYAGSARTLRWILENALKACEFQTNPTRPVVSLLISKYKSVIGAKTKKKQVRLFMSQQNAKLAFLERLKVYEETKRIAPSFKELINKLRQREIFKHAPELVDELKRNYSMLSDHVHPSVSHIAEHVEKRKPLTPKFDAQEFDSIHTLGLKILDMTEFLFIEALSHYFDFEDSKNYLKSVHDMIATPSGLATTFLKFPFTRKLTRGITWRTVQAKAKRAPDRKTKPQQETKRKKQGRSP